MIEHFDHLALTVQDLDRSIAWYVQVLGLERRYADVWSVPVMLCAGPTCIALFPATTPTPQPVPDYEQTLTIRHFAFRVTRANLARAQQRFEDLGQPFEIEDHGISYSLYVHDPDGYRVELTTYEVG